MPVQLVGSPRRGGRHTSAAARPWRALRCPDHAYSSPRGKRQSLVELVKTDAEPTAPGAGTGNPGGTISRPGPRPIAGHACDRAVADVSENRDPGKAPAASRTRARRQDRATCSRATDSWHVVGRLDDEPPRTGTESATASVLPRRRSDRAGGERRHSRERLGSSRRRRADHRSGARPATAALRALPDVDGSASTNGCPWSARAFVHLDDGGTSVAAWYRRSVSGLPRAPKVGTGPSATPEGRDATGGAAAPRRPRGSPRTMPPERPTGRRPPGTGGPTGSACS
jgi:hypothetical protein